MVYCIIKIQVSIYFCRKGYKINKERQSSTEDITSDARKRDGRQGLRKFQMFKEYFVTFLLVMLQYVIKTWENCLISRLHFLL